ncbi:MAG: PKD domain-containing protein, partial [Bacteroidota bacterium]
AVQFLAAERFGCSPKQISFLDQSGQGSGLITNWLWDFGDGNTSPQQFPSHTYTADGVYDVSLAVVDLNGCSDSLTRPQYIRLDHPEADFTVSSNQICPGTFLSFQDVSIPDTTLAGWFWDFGDGNTSTDPNPIHAYTSGGTYTVSLTVTNVLGCSDTETKVSQVEILPAPTPFFTVSNPMGCTPFSTIFTDNSIGNSSPIVAWSWAFGDGDSSTAQSPAHTFLQSGVYPVSLTVTDNNGCEATFTQSVEALSLPVADFLSVDTVDCAPHSAQFTDLSTGTSPIIGWSWDFGDGGTSSQQFPLYSYTQDGNFDISLTVTDQNGCVGATTKPAYIRLSNPDAAIGMDTTLGCPGLLVSFSDLSNPDTTLLSWSWDFGDGTGSSVQNPTHLYQNPGLYTVSLTVTNVLGCSDTEVLNQGINISTPPVAAIGVPANQGCVPFEVDFSDQSTVVSSPLVSWNWDFGDGNSSSLQEPMHTYTQAGTYPVSLTVTDAIGCSATASESITATAPPVAEFSANDSMGCAPKVIIFNNFSSGAHPIVSYAWDFGDGGTSIQQTPSHLYDQDGVYTVSLTVTDINGCTSTLTRPNYIRLSHPTADFSVNQANGCIGAEFAFTDESIGDTTLVGWLWDFGDGQVSTEQNPIHSFDTDGSYAVTLVITNLFGCRDTISYPNLINIFEGPTPIIQASDTSGCTPLQITLTNQSTSPFGLIDWEWFEDGVSVGQSLAINRLYTEPGDHEIELFVTDANGCVDSTMQLVHARPIPVADFTYSDSIGCGPAIIAFNDLSAHTPTDWFWEFGDGMTSTVQHPIHTYEEDGLYSVRLTITDQYGCTDDIERINLITLDHPEASFTVDYDLSCPPIEATFAASGSGLLGISKWEWDFGDGTIVVATQDTVLHSYADAGVYDVVLTATDSLGCSVVVDREQVIEVLANVVPDPVDIYAVSVLGDELVEVRFAAFRGEYFQYYTIYREEPGQGFVPIHTTEYLSDTVFLDTSANARESSHCYKVTTTNFCGFESDLLGTEQHCTVEATATPLPTQIVVEWNPYQGWPVSQYEVYKVNDYGPLNVSFVGVVPGNVTRFSEPFGDCFNEINYRILAIGENPMQISWSDTTQAAGETGVVGSPPEAIRVTVERDTFTLLEWKPIDMRGLSSVRIERSVNGGDFELRASLPGGEISFQDRDVRVDDNSYGYRLTAIDSCGNVTPQTAEQHSILLNVDKDENTNVLTWTPYRDWPLGVENYYVQIFNDTIQRWETVVDLTGNVTRFEDQITELDQGIYCYRILATRTGDTDVVSYSNEDCIRVETSVHGPNAFTPNGDGINDEFMMKGWHVASMNLQIFSRWGVKVFESNSIDEGWDGTFRGKQVEEGVYVYVARGVGNNGSVYVRKGSITLFR